MPGSTTADKPRVSRALFRPPAPIEPRDTMGLLKLRPMRLVILVDCRDISDVLSHLKPLARLRVLKDCTSASHRGSCIPC